MKTYRGHRKKDNETTVTVEQSDGKKTLLRHIPVHSPTGLEWGYLGSGPADLSLAILADMLGHEPPRYLYMIFKERVIARLMKGDWVMTEEDIRKAMEDKLPEYTRREIYGNRNIAGRQYKEGDVFYCGPTETIKDEEHAIELGVFDAWKQGYANYIVVDGKPLACFPLSKDDAHDSHLLQYGNKGILKCQCGHTIGRY